MALKVQTEISGDVCILHCSGRIVFGDENAALCERGRNILAGTTKVVVNLSGVDYIDSGGLKLVSPNQRVKELLRRTSLDNIFRVYGNNDEAIAAFREQIA